MKKNSQKPTSRDRVNRKSPKPRQTQSSPQLQLTTDMSTAAEENDDELEEAAKELSALLERYEQQTIDTEALCTTEEASNRAPFPLPAEVTESWKAMAAAEERFLREGPPGEIERFQRVRQAALANGGFRQWEAGQPTEEWKCVTSLLLWNKYVDEGEEAVRELLSYYLIWDCAFYLRQWWVANLIAKWHRAGEQEKIPRSNGVCG